MNSISTAPSPSARRLPPFVSGGTGQGVFVGLVPLTLLVIGVAITILLSALVLGLTGSVAFESRQAFMVAILVGGLLVSAAIYAVACVRALRQAKRWQRMGETRETAAALWALAASALVVLAPLLIAVTVPYLGP